MDDKKLVLCGPPASGKTTIKRVFFEMANPIRLLENTLDPTRGAETSIFNLFNSNIGIFDLAGQENDNWFSKDKNIFEKSDTILIVFDIKYSIKFILQFLQKIYRIVKQFNLFNCNLYLILHKIDLARKPYIISKIRSLNYLIEHKIGELSIKKIFRTSIKKKFFFRSFENCIEILSNLLDRELLPLRKEEFKALKIQLEILLKAEEGLKYPIYEFSEKIGISPIILSNSLYKLQDLGLLGIENNPQKIFRCTEKGIQFKNQIENAKYRNASKEHSRDVEMIYTILRFQKLEEMKENE